MHPPGRTRWSAPLSSNPPSPALINILARALIAGDQSLEATTSRVAETLGRPWPFLKPLARRYLKLFSPEKTRPQLRDVFHFLQQDEPFRRARQRHTLHIAQWTTAPHRMAPVPSARDWPIPPIETVAALAVFLDLTPTELDWYADRKRLTRKAPADQIGTSPLHHYHYRILNKPGGAIRLIEVPKPRLKHLQRQVLRRILDLIPCHEASHGFRPGRSIKTFAAPHTGQAVVLRIDLQDFFPSFSAARIQALFRTAGYPDSVAALLTALCTNTAPRSLFKPDVANPTLSASRALYTNPHLPQGTPTSPALANILTYRIDCRLTALAHAAGATYTRYADDLAFSGDAAFAHRSQRFALHVAAILYEEGLAVHHRKTRIMHQGVRQHLAGTVVNHHVNLPRPDYDRLKATLTNCLRHGPATQNRDHHPDLRRHLQGRISFLHMLNPTRAARLRTLFNQIDWT